MEKSAHFSSDRKHRFLLSRVWDKDKLLVGFICLNPSTADETNDDPTIRRCINYAKEWGYGGILIGNIFSYRSTDPKMLKVVKEPVAPINDYWLTYLFLKSKITVAAWGTHGKLNNRDKQVRRMLPYLNVLKLTKDGCPSHPLYLKKNLKPRRWKV